VKSARVMKKAVAHLIPFIEEEKGAGARSKGRIVMATVKGDVHDIGKNIVGVVLGCNNFEVEDLGVMVPAQKILDRAREINADMIGLSGLITPSLDEMVHVAREMQRQKFDVPLLIGGATTSPAHTSVKIEPNYTGPVTYVKDASRAVGIAQTLMSEGSSRQAFVTRLATEHETRRQRHAGKEVKAPQLSIASARANKASIDWGGYTPPVPEQLGITTLDDLELGQLAEYIDWMPFFNAWEFHGRFPAILTDALVGEAATSLFNDAQAMLDQIVSQRWLKARAVLGLFPANSVGDDIVVYADEDRRNPRFRLCHLRQQRKQRADSSNDCLADFVAPQGLNVPDYLGAFAVTAGLGIDAHVARFEAAHDDYSAILLKALADRLAEAAAEYLHARVRREYWGYAADEGLANDELIREAYQGIRPAPGYPACPDHTEKGLLWQLLDVERNAGMTLTESFAMLPTAAVSGWYLSHPDAHYFSVGKIGKDQLLDYAQRKGMDPALAERWLSPSLGYDADAA